MSLLKTIWIREGELDFRYKVYVNKDGEFTTTFPPEISELFIKANIRLMNNQLGNPGFFNAESLIELKQKVLDIIEEYHSRVLISKSIVIRYIIQTTCAYCLDIDGEIVPNGQKRWVKSDSYEWKNGTIDQHAAQPKPFGISIYAKAVTKEIYKYKSGKIKEEYYKIDTTEGTYIDFLNEFQCMSQPKGEHLKEIDYTEDSAKFFVDLLTSICRINEQIKDHLEPDRIQKIIDSKQKLLS